MFNLARITKNSQRIVRDSLGLSRNLSSAVQPNRNPNTDCNKVNFQFKVLNDHFITRNT